MNQTIRARIDEDTQLYTLEYVGLVTYHDMPARQALHTLQAHHYDKPADRETVRVMNQIHRECKGVRLHHNKYAEK